MEGRKAILRVHAKGKPFSPDVDLDSLPYEVHTPDGFLVLVDDSAPHRVRAVTRDQERYWDRRPRSKSLVQALQDAGCPDFAQRILVHLCELPAASANT